MTFILRCLTVFLMLTATTCYATLEISVGNHEARPGETVDIPVMISGPDAFQNFALAFGVGDNGPVVGGSETIAVSAVDFTTGPTVWSSFFPTPGLNTSFAPMLPSQSASIVNVSINQVTNTSTAVSDLLMTMTLDLSSVPISRVGETVSLNLNVNNLSAASNSDGVQFDFINGGLTFNDGLLTIVPEPSPVLLVGACGFLLGGSWLLLRLFLMLRQLGWSLRGAVCRGLAVVRLS